MSARVNLTLFAHVAGRPEDELDLAEAALLVADSEYPGLDVAHYTGMLDELGRRARLAASRAGATGPEEARLERAVRFLYEDAGFRGNEGDYYDPRNSFLNDVLDRRIGIPITLAIVLTEVCHRAGVDARGVSFPGHFLVRSDTPRGSLLVDPFSGRLLAREDVRALYKRATNDDSEPPSRVFEAATKPQILVRLLNNLRSIYESRSDSDRLRSVLERLAVLSPSDELRRQIADLGGSSPWRSSGRALN